MTESLEYVPGRFKVVRHVREAFSCRCCESIVQAPAPHHAIMRGRAGPGLLAHIVVAKFDDHCRSTAMCGWPPVCKGKVLLRMEIACGHVSGLGDAVDADRWP